MKCIKNTKGKVIRVTNLLAEERVDSGDYKYCGKAEWKKQSKKKASVSI
jgi:hypothetical protein